jgi:hypothetical protein
MRLRNLAPAPHPQVLWLGYGLLLSALSWALFGSLLQLPHDLDDLPALRDNLKIDEELWVILHGFYHPSGRPVGALLVDAGKLEGLRCYLKAVDLDKHYHRFGALIQGLKQHHRLEEAIAYAAQLDQTAAARRFAELARQAR